MAKYNITIKKSADRELQDIPKKDLLRIIKHIQSLAENPRPAGPQKLSSRERYRIRQSDYRIIYSVDDGRFVVDVVKIGHTPEIYR